jgi:pyruvate dehydrogenase (quinone)
MLFLGNPEFGCDLAPVDFAQVAQGLGVHGLRVDDPDAIGAALDQAFAMDGPVLIDAVVDANEIMLPPKRREPYMEHLAQAFETGTPGQETIQLRMREEPAATSLKP